MLNSPSLADNSSKSLSTRNSANLRSCDASMAFSDLRMRCLDVAIHCAGGPTVGVSGWRAERSEAKPVHCTPGLACPIVLKKSCLTLPTLCLTAYLLIEIMRAEYGRR